MASTVRPCECTSNSGISRKHQVSATRDHCLQIRLLTLGIITRLFRSSCAHSTHWRTNSERRSSGCSPLVSRWSELAVTHSFFSMPGRAAFISLRLSVRPVVAIEFNIFSSLNSSLIERPANLVCGERNNSPFCLRGCALVAFAN